MVQSKEHLIYYKGKIIEKYLITDHKFNIKEEHDYIIRNEIRKMKMNKIKRY